MEAACGPWPLPADLTQNGSEAPSLCRTEQCVGCDEYMYFYRQVVCWGGGDSQFPHGLELVEGRLCSPGIFALVISSLSRALVLSDHLSVLGPLLSTLGGPTLVLPSP